jgi:hypothetical protein
MIHLFSGGGTRIRRGKKRTFASRTYSVPLAMLILVVITSLNQDGSCEADFGTECYFENSGFMNAFARRCICKGVTVV